MSSPIRETVKFEIWIRLGQFLVQFLALRLLYSQMVAKRSPLFTLKGNFCLFKYLSEEKLHRFPITLSLAFSF